MEGRERPGVQETLGALGQAGPVPRQAPHGQSNGGDMDFAGEDCLSIDLFPTSEIASSDSGFLGLSCLE